MFCRVPIIKVTSGLPWEIFCCFSKLCVLVQMFATNVLWQSNEDILLLEEGADTNLNNVALTDPFLCQFSV